ncbi:MAG: signal peptidase I [Candidatus Komeilibacteria bacterium]
MAAFSSKKDIGQRAERGALRVAGSIFGLILETIKVVLISMAIILPIRYFLIQPFYVEGASMEPTFNSNEYLLVDEITFRFQGPKRGEVVVFRYPRDPRQFFIKRVIGLPGETISIQAGKILINGQELDEVYLDELRVGDSNIEPLVIPADHYFLMGDNRANSLDSRIFGSVEKKFVIGRVWLRGWPLDKFSFFVTPKY